MDCFPTFRRIPGALREEISDLTESLPAIPGRVLAWLCRAPVTVAIVLGMSLLYAGVWFVGGEPGLERLVDAWGSSGVDDGRWWTAVTSSFVHQDLGHLQSNLTWIVPLGLLVEPRMGQLQMLLLVLFASLAATAGTVLLEASAGHGASGILFALAGAILSRPLWIDSAGRRIYNGMWPFLAVYCCVSLHRGLDSGFTSFSAHFGGLLAGLWIGTIRWKEDPRPPFQCSRARHRQAVAAFTMAYALVLLPNVRWQLPWHESRMLHAESRGDLLKAEEHWWAIVRLGNHASGYDARYLAAAGLFSQRHNNDSWALALLSPSEWQLDAPWIHAEIGFLRASLRPGDLRGAMRAWRSAATFGDPDPYVLNAMAETHVFFCGDSTLHDPAKAVDLARKAVDADRTCDARFMHTLAWSCFESGDRSAGVRWMESAVSVADSASAATWSDDLRWMRERAEHAEATSRETPRPRGYLERITF